MSIEKHENLLANKEKSLINLLNDEDPSNFLTVCLQGYLLFFFIETRKFAAFFICINANENVSFQNKIRENIPFNFNESSKNSIIIFNHPKKISPKILISMKSGFS